MFRCLYKCFATAPMPSHNQPNGPTFPKPNHRSFLVTLSARVIGSLGFGLSILAIGFRWLVPVATTVTPGVGNESERRANHRSRSRSVLALPARLIMPPATPITVNGRNTTSDLYRDKHVYFADTLGFQRSSISTAHMMTLDDTPVEQFSAGGNPQPSTQTLPTTTSSLTKSINMKQDDEPFAESDSWSRRSSLAFHLPKRILYFRNKSRQRPGTSVIVTRSLRLSGEGKHSRQSNMGFVPPWSPRRKFLGTQPDVNDEDNRPLTPLKSADFPSVSNDSIQRSGVSFFSFKAHRRCISAPNSRMRTQPYDAPYFALPPTNTTFDLRKSPLTFHEASTNSHMEHSLEDNRGRLQSPRRSLIKRRSASEGLNGRRAVSLL